MGSGRNTEGDKLVARVISEQQEEAAKSAERSNPEKPSGAKK